jgi:hypothetical protein
MFMRIPDSTPIDDVVPSELRAVVDLFQRDLATVTFPDVDAAALQREIDAVRTRTAELERAREALAVAEAALSQRTAALAQLAARGLAYARIYAEADPDREPLARKIAALTAPVAAAPTDAPPRRRGRPPKSPEKRAELLFATEGATPPASAG